MRKRGVRKMWMYRKMIEALIKVTATTQMRGAISEDYFEIVSLIQGKGSCHTP